MSFCLQHFPAVQLAPQLPRWAVIRAVKAAINMPEQTHSKPAPFTTTLNTTCRPRQRSTPPHHRLHRSLGGARLEVNVCNYKMSFIGHYGQMERSTFLPNKNVKAAVERVVKEMQTEEHEAPGGFSVCNFTLHPDKFCLRPFNGRLFVHHPENLCLFRAHSRRN